MKIVTYDVDKYPFVYWIEKILGMTPLDKIHETLDQYPPIVVHETDQTTKLHKQYYSKQHLLLPLFEQFVGQVVRPLFTEEILYQAKPSFRCQFPNNLSVGAFHKDSDYGHHEQEINFFIPVTKCFKTNAMWIESSPNSEDYIPVNLNVGQMLVFNGANLGHGNKLNKTGLTRVSFDFRVLPKSHYDPHNQRVTTNMRKRMIIGDYFNVCC